MKSRLLLAGCVYGFIVPCESFSSPDPRLSIRQEAGQIQLSWPATATNWVLEVSAALPPAVPWVCVMPENYQTDGESRFVRVAAAMDQRFYRLRRLTPSVPGLTGHWRLDEGTGAVGGDESDTGTVLFTSGTTWGSGRFGPGALRFNGGSQVSGGSRVWASNENYRVLPPAGQPFSVSCWFNPEVLTAGWRGLAGTDSTGTNGWRVAVHTPGPGTNYLVFAGVGAGGGLSLTGRSLLLPGQWRQLTVTHDGAEGSLYLDGALLARRAGAVPAQEGPIYFGGGVDGLDSFLGRLDDIRTYTNCLTPEQIALNGHWRFDEGCGDFLADSSVNGRHGSVTEATAWAPGREGSGIDLNYGQVLIGNEYNAVLPPSGGPFSVSLWLRPDGLSEGRSELMSCGVAPGSGWRLAVEVDPSNQARLRLESTNLGGTLDLQAPVQLNIGVWTKLDLTYNGGVATLYADGRKLQSASGAIRGSQAPLLVGAVTGTRNFNGQIDELKIYGRARSEAEIGPVAAVMWETVLWNSSTNFVLAGSGPAGRPLTYAFSPLIFPTNGTLSLAANSAVVTYTAGGRKGPDAFAYTVSDGEFTSPPATVTISVVEPHWLSPGGGSIEPRDGSSPAQAWVASPTEALDAIWKTNNYYDCFFYGPGEYQTHGWKYAERPTAHPGCKHIGAGAEGPGRTTLRLVDIWEPWNEELIFATATGGSCDGFEVHQMELNCNAENIPKYTRGEPVWIRIPLAEASPVNSVTLRWSSGAVPTEPIWQMGRPAEFKLSAWRSGTNTFGANGPTLASTGQVDVVVVGAMADELILQLERRMAGVDFYGLSEIEVPGASISLPVATTVPGGLESRLDKTHAAQFLADGDTFSSWASGPEGQAQILLPLPAGSAVDRIHLNWNCKTLTNFGRLGPAALYTIRARDEGTGDYYDVPFERQSRTSAGRETAIFGTEQSPVELVTDRLVLLLTSREAGVDFYSLKEVSPGNGATPIGLRLPEARSSLSWGASFPVQFAVDRDPATRWANGTQGSVTALNVYGNNLKFTHLRIIGFGSKAGRECFPLGVGLPSHLSTFVGNVLIEDCTFSEPATHNTDGLTTMFLGGIAGFRLTNAVVRRCTVSGVRPWFTYSHGVTAPHVENCLFVDCGQGVYFEPVKGENDGRVLVRSNLFQNVLAGVFVLTHPGATFDSITCLNNEIVLAGGGSGVSVCDLCAGPPSGTVTNITALNNIIRYPGWAPRPFSLDSALLYSDIQHAVFGNNAIALGNPSALRVRQCPIGVMPGDIPDEDCDHPGPGQPGPSTPLPCMDTLQPGYRRAWFQNRDVSGLLLPVRTFNNSLDVLATQQQWPD